MKKMTKAARFGVKSSEDRGWTQLAEILGIGSAINRRISEFGALKQGSVTAATDVLAQDTSKGRLRLKQLTPKGDLVVAPDAHPLAHKLALDPNPFMSWADVVENVVRHLALHQNGYLFKKRRSLIDTNPDLVPIHPQHVTKQTNGQRFYYNVSGVPLGVATMLGWQHDDVLQDDMIHIIGRGYDGVQGLSTLALGADILGLNSLLVEFQSKMVAAGMKPPGYITIEGNIEDDAQFARFKSEMESIWKDSVGKGIPMLLEGAAKFESIALDAAKTDLTKSRQQVRQEVAALFRVPSYKIGADESQKYDNKHAAEQTYVDDTIVPLAMKVETALSRGLLTEAERLAGYHLEIDRDDLYDRDRQQASERTVKQFAEGIISRGQACAALNLPPVEEHLDTYRLPANSAVLSKDGTITPVSAKPSANEPGADEKPPAKLALVR